MYTCNWIVSPVRTCTPKMSSDWCLFSRAHSLSWPCRRWVVIAISPHVMSAPNRLHIRRYGKLPTWQTKQNEIQIYEIRQSALPNEGNRTVNNYFNKTTLADYIRYIGTLNHVSVLSFAAKFCPEYYSFMFFEVDLT